MLGLIRYGRTRLPTKGILGDWIDEVRSTVDLESAHPETSSGSPGNPTVALPVPSRALDLKISTPECRQHKGEPRPRPFRSLCKFPHDLGGQT